MGDTIVLELIKILLGSGVLVSIFLYFRKHRDDQKLKANEQFIQQRMNSLLELKKVMNQLKYKELINLTHPQYFNTGFGGLKKDFWVYKTVMEDRKSLWDFTVSVMNYRSENEFWMTNKLSAEVLYLENYLLQMQEYFTKSGVGEELYPYGILFFNDLDNLYNRIMLTINECMNNLPLKNENHSGEEWEDAKIDAKKLFKDNVINKLESNDEETCMIFEMTKMIYIENIEKKSIDSQIQEVEEIKMNQKNNLGNSDEAVLILEKDVPRYIDFEER